MRINIITAPLPGGEQPGSLSPGRTGAPAADGARFSIPPDDGCQYSSSCLECPLPACKHDMPPEELHAELRRIEDRKKADMILREGLTAKEAAARLGVTVRSVYRIMGRVREQKQDDASTQTGRQE